LFPVMAIAQIVSIDGADLFLGENTTQTYGIVG
jgi:hypothetical protein